MKGHEGASDDKIRRDDSDNFEGVFKFYRANDGTTSYSNENGNDDVIANGNGIGSEYDFDNGLYCPICYEAYTTPDSSRPTDIEEAITHIELERTRTEENSETSSCKCSCSDGGTHADSIVGKEGPRDVIINSDIDTKRDQRCTDDQKFAEDYESSPVRRLHCGGRNSNCDQATCGQEDCDCSRFHCTTLQHQHKHPRQKVTIPVCGHEFCRGCIRDHCTYSISIRDLPIRCPKLSSDGRSGSQCSVFLPIDIVEDLLQCSTKCGEWNNEDWIKFQRLHRMLEDPSLIPCTRCNEPIPSDNILKPKGKDDDVNRIQCPSCKHVFCRIRGDGVYSSSTGAVDLDRNAEHRKQLEQSENAIRELCKPCSHCMVPIWKVDGCNHVVCPVCKKDMCFRCGTHDHLETSETSTAIRTCRVCKGSYLDHRCLWRHRLGMMAKLPLMLPVCILYVTMTLSLAVATGGCFCCLGCGVRFKKIKENATGKGRSDMSPEIICVPIIAVREVMGWVMEPFIDLFNEFQLPCCFCHNAPGLCKGGVTDDEEDSPGLDSDGERSEVTSGRDNDGERSKVTSGRDSDDERSEETGNDVESQIMSR